ncbi:hypothetical protein C8R48DRAFT_737987, partial [Suillus tomentosus]
IQAIPIPRPLHLAPSARSYLSSFKEEACPQRKQSTYASASTGWYKHSLHSPFQHPPAGLHHERSAL